ncbi:MAG: biotin--[acetyl-CoA-carboxylase] ligase [Steroidobacteraceae bacterium]|jgi:BirA family biotin operon repressor/biotin-[acetyl-CoA-carboxylase] ligase|nr:biotin--[acetyl-CoA-carboxylase] ligase [Steroidobacteraceae bacterium]
MAFTTSARSEARRRRLLALMSDGEFHSGELLAKRLRISRAAVWKLMGVLRSMGVEVESVARQGYRLPRAVDLLDKEEILEGLSPAARERLDRLDVLLSVDSTNRYVGDLEPAPAGRAQLCVTELQNAGRGRRGRSWVAPFGSGVCLSLGWQFADAPPNFPALGLAVAVAVVRALGRCGAHEVGLKWPNDLIWRQRKLGGILIEMRGESAGPAHVVIGVGLNMHMPAATRLELAEHQAALIADLHEVLQERTPSRNRVIAALADEMISVLETFAVRGFEAFIDEWRALDTLADAPVKVINGAQTLYGVARGVEADGALLVEVDGQLQKFVSGEVSLRKQIADSG